MQLNARYDSLSLSVEQDMDNCHDHGLCKDQFRASKSSSHSIIPMMAFEIFVLAFNMRIAQTNPLYNLSIQNESSNDSNQERSLSMRVASFLCKFACYSPKKRALSCFIVTLLQLWFGKFNNVGVTETCKNAKFCAQRDEVG